MFKPLLGHKVLTSVTFWLVIALGSYAYMALPREQDPSVNFNWVQIMTAWSGASAVDMERRVTTPLEEGLVKVSDIKFMSSTSREGLSSILVRFNDLNTDQFNRRISDLRREVQTKEAELPDDIDGPHFLEITSANAFPTASLVIVGHSNDATLRRYARIAEEDLERWAEIDRADSFGSADPELLVHFSLGRLAGLGVNPAEIADTVKSYFRDLAAGTVTLGEQEWIVRLTGTSTDPEFVGRLPVAVRDGEVPLRSIADISFGTEDPQQIVHFNGRPAILMSVFKQDKANNLELLEKLRRYIQNRNATSQSLGIEMVLIDDQTVATKDALTVMQDNALIGLALVFFVTWAFLGTRIALFTTLGIPFVLAGTLFILYLMGQTLNVTVLLAIVITLGMLVDDAIVVVEGIYHHLQRGLNAADAVVQGLREAVPPVTTAVMTTIAAFLPLLLLPGLLGDFMRVVPIVVIVALLMSLVEAYWMLPAHILHSRVAADRHGAIHEMRQRVTISIRRHYSRYLVFALRRSRQSLSFFAGIAVLAVLLLFSGLIRMDFFASDFFRIFYVNVVMPPGTSLEKTSSKLIELERVVKAHLRPEETRAVTTYAGIGYTEKDPVIGNEFGQIFVTLQPDAGELQNVDEVIESMRSAVEQIPGPLQVTFERRKTGPPTAKPINLKLRGDSFQTLRAAADTMQKELTAVPGIKDVADDDLQGKRELTVRLNPDAVTRAGLAPAEVIRMVRLFADGEIVARMQHEGDEVAVRVRARPQNLQNIDQFLANTVALNDGGEISLGELLFFDDRRTQDSIRHYNLRRSITIEGDVDPEIIDTVAANAIIKQLWSKHASAFPDIDIDLSGELDDIQQGAKAMGLLFLVGLGIIFLILGTQFKSYVQPLLVLIAVPMAFVGVIFGLLITNNPLSLYTLYGVIALAGIAANDAIVMISAANRHLHNGLTKIHAITYAAKRRVIPILITSLTTIAGLFSLATGLAGESLLWGPVATSIVWGLGFSTLLTLFVVPLLYQTFVQTPSPGTFALAPPPLPEHIRSHGLPFLDIPGLGGLAGILNPPATQQLPGLERLEGNAHYRSLYEDGAKAFAEKNIEIAIRSFEELADLEPDNAAFNLYASEAHIEYMRLHGWDIGYMARAKRYLARARKRFPKAALLAQLDAAIASLDAQSEAAHSAPN